MMVIELMVYYHHVLYPLIHNHSWFYSWNYYIFAYSLVGDIPYRLWIFHITTIVTGLLPQLITMVETPISWDIGPITMVRYPFLFGTALPCNRFNGESTNSTWENHGICLDKDNRDKHGIYHSYVCKKRNNRQICHGIYVSVYISYHMEVYWTMTMINKMIYQEQYKISADSEGDRSNW